MAKEILVSEELHRNQSLTPIPHNSAERFKYCNWIKHNKKLLNVSEMKEDRVTLFDELMEKGERYKQKNQYE